MKRNLLFLFMLGIFVSFNSCGDDEEPEDEAKNIVELASDTDNLSTLVSALTQADLVSALEASGPFTVFAPTNAAFQDLLDSNDDWDSLADIDNATLSSVLLFHVIEGEVLAADLTDAYVPSLSSGPNDEAISLQTAVTGGVSFNGSAEPSTTDVDATNGVVHIIDEVMLPPTVVDLALNNDIFSTLVAALTREDLTTDFVSILSGEGPFTVFAPTNDAFAALLAEVPEWNELADIPVETLEAVLKYHVVSGGNVQSDELTDGQNIPTLGGTLTTDLSEGAKLETSSGQSVGIAVTDVQGANGVVHAVSAVLLP